MFKDIGSSAAGEGWMVPDLRPRTSRIGGVGWFDDLNPSLFVIPIGSHFCDDQLSILIDDIVGTRIFIAHEKCVTMVTEAIEILANLCEG